ncbi:MAG: GyrI-like domain-containing protein [Granulosicoccaceae bacterium]
MLAFQTEASIDIEANIETVRAELTDFKSWPIWSPWLYVEPDSKVAFHGSTGNVGAGNSWMGDKTGEGRITLVKNEPERLELDLDFIKPFKSHADVYFDLTAINEHKTHINWGMNSSLPFFMFWMKNSMVAMIKSDYRRGLLLLKDHIELGKIPSTATFHELSSVNEMPYVGLHGICAMDDIADTMKEQFSLLTQATASMKPTEMFTVCNRLDVKADSMDYTAAVGVGAVQVGTVTKLESPLIRGKRAACKAIKVTHVGPYRHLANAWYMAITEQRHGKYKLVSKAPAFEIYRNSPVDTDENDLITEIYIPVAP